MKKYSQKILDDAVKVLPTLSSPEEISEFIGAHMAPILAIIMKIHTNYEERATAIKMIHDKLLKVIQGEMN